MNTIVSFVSSGEGVILNLDIVFLVSVGSGLAGVEELKAHPFFSGVDWSTV